MKIVTEISELRNPGDLLISDDLSENLLAGIILVAIQEYSALKYRVIRRLLLGTNYYTQQSIWWHEEHIK